jgi:hypothetical protein
VVGTTAYFQTLYCEIITTYTMSLQKNLFCCKLHLLNEINFCEFQLIATARFSLFLLFIFLLASIVCTVHMPHSVITLPNVRNKILPRYCKRFTAKLQKKFSIIKQKLSSPRAVYRSGIWKREFSALPRALLAISKSISVSFVDRGRLHLECSGFCGCSLTSN